MATFKPKSRAHLKKRYGTFFKVRRRIDITMLPSELLPLQPYIELWGTNADLIDLAPRRAKNDLLGIFADRRFRSLIAGWLGDTAVIERSGKSNTYAGLAAMSFAFDSAKALAKWEKVGGPSNRDIERAKEKLETMVSKVLRQLRR